MSPEVALRRRILDVLAYPRQIAMANVDLSRCPYSGVFNSADPKCQECSKYYECDWLSSTGEFNDIAEMPMEFLYRALTFGIDYVHAQPKLEDHDSANCECDSCEWARIAHRLSHEYVQIAPQISAAPLQEKRT